ncbi:MAG: carboxypeptidase regulatory-like domain-containing protein [Acidobacteriota bacterium]|nr:carboxypeptidase regulatory-like domain-containing protein [Acidobacteriota bacterium]
MSRWRCKRWLLAVAPLLLLAMAVPAIAQLQTGDIYCKVVDDKSQPLPGVTVTVTGIGAPRVEVTDAAGQVRFLGLYPGRYNLKAELQGYNSVDYPNFTVAIGARPSVEMTLSPALTEAITVTAEKPLLDERSTNRGTTLSAVDLNKVPTARDPWSLLSQAPGVRTDRINVGGNESGQQSNFIGVGSGSRDNTFAVDGVVLTDMNAVGGSLTYFDFGAFEEVQLTVSSADVTIATSGVTVNQVTKRGTNEWRGNARYLRTDGSLQAKPFTTDGNRIKSVSEYGADVGGPIWRDHLWGWVADGRSEINNIAQGGQLDGTKLKDFNSKLNFQLGQQDSGVAHFWTNDKLKNGRNAGPTTAPESTLDQTTPQDIYKFEDTYLVGQNLTFTALFARDQGQFTLTPKGGLNADIFRDDKGVLRGSNFDFKQDSSMDQYRLDGSYFFNAGSTSNELKFGGSHREQDNASGTVWPGGKFVVSCVFLGCTDPANPGKEQVVFPRNRKVVIASKYTSAWVQDTLSAGRLTASAGLRYDNQRMANGPAFEGGNPLAQGLLPPIDFKGNNDGGYDWRTVQPRLSATYALGAERKTLLRGTFSRYAEQLGQLPLATRVNPLGYSYAYFYFTDANHNFKLDPNEVGSLVYAYTNNINAANPGSTTTPSVNSRNLKPALTDEATLGWEQGFGSNIASGLTLTYRHIHDIPETRVLVVDQTTGLTRTATRGDYVVSPSQSVSSVLPNGQQVTVPVYVLRDGLTPTGGSLFTNGDRVQNYLGATLYGSKRLANQWTARGSVTWNDWKWKIGQQYKANHDPTSLVNDELGYATQDGVFAEQSTGSGNKGSVFSGGKWSFNAFTLYEVAPTRPWGFDAGLSFTGRQGYVSPPYVRKSGPTGSRFVLLSSQIDSFRNDNIFVLDGHLSKDIKISDLGVTISFDGFNLTNQHYILQRERNANLLTYAVTERLSPRVFRVGAILHWK